MSRILKFLGCGAAFNPLLGNTSAYFTEQSNLYLMDCGESVFCKLYQQDLLTKYENYYIVITHMHADHVGSLGSLISYMYFVLHKKVHVIHPSEKLVELLDLTGIIREAYEMHLCREFTAGAVRFAAVPAQHAEDMACFKIGRASCRERV